MASPEEPMSNLRGSGPRPFRRRDASARHGSAWGRPAPGGHRITSRHGGTISRDGAKAPVGLQGPCRDSGTVRVRPDHPENLPPLQWREDTDRLRLAVVAAAYRARVERAIVERDEEAGAAAHTCLISAEWRLRQAERRRL